MKKRNSLIVFALSVFFISFTSVVSAQEKATISGYVKDATNGETLIGATVYVKELKTGTTSNEYGFYSISIPPGSYEFEFSYIGFEAQIEKVNLMGNVKLDVELGEGAEELIEVVVSSEAADRNVSDLEMSVNKLDVATIKKMPTLLGEVDVIRSIQLLPGVSTVGEGASGFNVRGGSVDQNLVLLDEAPVFNSSHLFGFFSVFNPDAVKDVKLYKGGIPSRYGGRLSSILDVRMKEGNNKKFEMKGGVGLIFSRLSVEAPIVKDKASFIFAARRSYIDVLARPFLNDGLDGSKLSFYDLTLKTNYNINERNKLFVSGYFGRDVFGFGDQAGFNWGNATGTVRWNHLFNDKLFSNVTFYYSDYDYRIDFGDESDNKFDWDARIVNYSVKPEFAYYITPNNSVRFGGQAIVYEFEPGNAVAVSEGDETDFSQDEKYALEGALYAEHEVKFSQFELNYGLRFSYFNYMGEGTAYTYGEAEQGFRRPVTDAQEFDQWESIEDYINFEPRLSLKYQISPQNSVKASYMRTAQYIHLISNTTASTPLDVWTPSTNNIKPQTAHQIALGYFQNFRGNDYELSAEVYWKKMDHLVDYIDGADLLLNEFLEGDLLEGDGRAYGMELMLKRNVGKLNGWASYTLGRTERKVEGINGDDWYPSRFDQTHNFNISAFYEVSKRFSLSANFVIISGTPTTFPTSRFEQQGYVIPHNGNNRRNNVRIPTYHRMDVSATLEGKKNEERRWQSQWVFSVYNIYNRRNPFSIYFAQQEGRLPVGAPVNTEAVQLSVIGNFIPSVSYNFEF